MEDRYPSLPATQVNHQTSPLTVPQTTSAAAPIVAQSSASFPVGSSAPYSVVQVPSGMPRHVASPIGAPNVYPQPTQYSQLAPPALYIPRGLEQRDGNFRQYPLQPGRQQPLPNGYLYQSPFPQQQIVPCRVPLTPFLQPPGQQRFLNPATPPSLPSPHSSVAYVSEPQLHVQSRPRSLEQDLSEALNDLHKQVNEHRAQISKSHDLKEQTEVLRAIRQDGPSKLKQIESCSEVAQSHLSAYLDFDLVLVAPFVRNFYEQTKDAVDWRDRLFDMMKAFFKAYPELKYQFYEAFRNYQGDCLSPNGLLDETSEGESIGAPKRDYTKLLFGNSPQAEPDLSNESVVRRYNHQFLAILREVILTNGINPFLTDGKLKNYSNRKLIELQESLCAWKSNIRDLKSCAGNRTLDVARRLEMLYGRVNYEVICRQLAALEKDDRDYKPELLQKVLSEFLRAGSYHATDKKYEVFHLEFQTGVKEIARRLGKVPEEARDAILAAISVRGLENLRSGNRDYYRNSCDFYVDRERQELEGYCNGLNAHLGKIIERHLDSYGGAIDEYIISVERLRKNASRQSLLNLFLERDTALETLHLAVNEMELADAESRRGSVSPAAVEQLQRARNKMSELLSHLLLEISEDTKAVGVLSDESIRTLISLCEYHDIYEASQPGLRVLHRASEKRKAQG